MSGSTDATRSAADGPPAHPQLPFEEALAACLTSIEETAGCIRDAGIDPAAAAEEPRLGPRAAGDGGSASADRCAVAAAGVEGVERCTDVSLAEELRQAEEEVARVREFTCMYMLFSKTHYQALQGTPLMYTS